MKEAFSKSKASKICLPTMSTVEALKKLSENLNLGFDKSFDIVRQIFPAPERVFSVDKNIHNMT